MSLRRRRPHHAFALALLFSTGARAFADEPPRPTADQYEERIRALEERLKKLEEHQAAAPAPAPVAAPSPPAPQQPLDVREPPFGEFDFSWLEGNNRQPASLLSWGPVTGFFYLDAYYAFQFSQPSDHTIFPTTTAPRHNELSVNLAALGVDVALDGPIGRVYVQWASNVTTDAGQDASVQRGFYLTSAAFQYIQQAAGGWHFHWLHGVNLEMGIFPSYFSVESYLPQENWNYTHSFVADSTPYYYSGIRAQLFVTRRLKVELWLMNGWQTFGQWHESRAGGYQLNWRPRAWFTLAANGYVGQDVRDDPDPVRVYFDQIAQVSWFSGGKLLKRAASFFLADVGYDHRSNAPSGVLGAGTFGTRLDWAHGFSTSLRLDVLYDQTRAIIPQPPLGSNLVLPGAGTPFWGGGVTLTLDYAPSPWLLTRIEYAHREANTNYFSGSSGLSPAVPTVPLSGLVPRDDRLIANVTLRL